MTDLTARITEMLRALPSPIGAEPFTENDDGAPMWLSCLPWELLLCKVAKIAAAATEEHYRPRVETVEQLDALPIGAVVAHTESRDEGTEYRKVGPYVWAKFGDSRMYNAPPIYRHTPLYLLWSPGADE